MMAAPAGPQKAHEARYRLKACMKSLDLRIEGDARTVVEAPPRHRAKGTLPHALPLGASTQTLSLHSEMSEAFRLARLVSSLSTRRVRLAAFVGFLRANGVLPKFQEYAEQEDTLQKCAFIAQEGFGLGLGYEYHLTEYGTFSSFLAADYHGLVEARAHSGGLFMQPQFAKKALVSLVSGKGERWLALASTMVHELGLCEEGHMLGHAEGICAYYEKRLARRVMADLKSALPPARWAGA